MTTQFIGMKDFRQNMATYTKKAKDQKIRFIVLKKNVPILEIKAIDEKDITLEKLAADINEAREQAKRGEVYSEEEVYKKLGL